MTGILGIDHVAIVTSDLARSRRFYRKLGLAASRHFKVTEKFPEDSVLHKYLAFAVLFKDKGPVLWIMQPAGKSGPLRKFLGRRGPGLHHVGLRASNTMREEARLRRKGVRFVRRAMVDEGEVRALLHPDESDKVLIELVQRLPKT